MRFFVLCSEIIIQFYKTSIFFLIFFQTEYHGPCGPMVISNQASSVYNSYPVNSNDTSNNAACSSSIAGGVSGTGAMSSGSGNTYNSRRSSYSPSDRSRGRDSIAFTHGGEIHIAITPWHRSILILFEVWFFIIEFNIISTTTCDLVVFLIKD